jgi:hypothetical protein
MKLVLATKMPDPLSPGNHFGMIKTISLKLVLHAGAGSKYTT